MKLLRRPIVPFAAILIVEQLLRHRSPSPRKTRKTPLQLPDGRAEARLHALNRLAFGPRPGDVERVTAMGVDKWIDQQLHPEKIDDHALDARLAPFRTLRMDTREMVENFPPPQVIKAIAEGKQSLPSDSAKRAVYEAQLERYQEKQERKQEATNADPAAAGASGKPAPMSDEEQARRREDRLYADLKTEDLLDLPPDQRMKAILKMSPEDQRAIGTSLKGDKRDEFMEGMKPQQRETLMALNNPQQVVTDELVQSKLLRAIYSDRQLEEVMTDFWFNHFNVFIGKGADRYMLTSYERDVIRPHALGKFEDLLVATAHSPAMLFYLDNWLSVGPNSDFANGIPKRPNNYNWRRPPRQRRPPQVKQAKGKRSGLNENYGRELMELHTLGVNGGYTQKDVTEVARVLTGWTLKQPRQGGGFTFEERMHEPGDKNVLGHRIKSNGEKEGREVLHILARHPSTAKFISTKLAMRFVSDNPPPALVDRMAQTFLKKDGDIREVLKTMLHSPEFWAPDVVSGQSENSAGVRSVSGSRQRRRSQRRPAPGPSASNHGHATLRNAAADRVFDESRCLGELVRAAGTNEFRAGPDRRKTQRRAGRLRSHSYCGQFASRSASNAGGAGDQFAGRRRIPADARHDCRADAAGDE